MKKSATKYLIFGISFFLSFVLGFMVGQEPKPLAEQVLRLQILAHDDSVHEQEKKLLVRDLVLELLAEPFHELKNVEEALVYTHENLEILEQGLQEKLIVLGYTDQVKAGLVRETFPQVSYGEKILPQGEYWALKIIVEAGQGVNWWCVLYPPLCYGQMVKSQVQPVFATSPEKKEDNSSWSRLKKITLREVKKLWLAQ